MRVIQSLVLVCLLALPLPLALAQDGGPAASSERASGAASDDPLVRYLLGLGPIGALVYGAFMLGKGVRVSIEVHLSEEDRRLADRATTAVEKLQIPYAGVAPLPYPRASGG